MKQTFLPKCQNICLLKRHLIACLCKYYSTATAGKYFECNWQGVSEAANGELMGLHWHWCGHWATGKLGPGVSSGWTLDTTLTPSAVHYLGVPTL